MGEEGIAGYIPDGGQRCLRSGLSVGEEIRFEENKEARRRVRTASVS